jgi:hypothetical protein
MDTCSPDKTEETGWLHGIKCYHEWPPNTDLSQCESVAVRWSVVRPLSVGFFFQWKIPFFHFCFFSNDWNYFFFLLYLSFKNALSHFFHTFENFKIDR